MTSSNRWWNANWTYSVSSLVAPPAASPWEFWQPRAPAMLPFSYTAPSKATLEDPGFTYEPPARCQACKMTDSQVISQGKIHEKTFRGEKMTTLVRADIPQTGPEAWGMLPTWELHFGHSNELTLGTPDLGGHLPPGSPEPKPLSPGDFGKLWMWTCTETGLKWAKGKGLSPLLVSCSTSSCPYTFWSPSMRFLTCLLTVSFCLPIPSASCDLFPLQNWFSIFYSLQSSFRIFEVFAPKILGISQVQVKLQAWNTKQDSHSLPLYFI